jgi:hypothetical protein
MANSCETRPKGLKAMLKSWYFWKPFLSIILGATAGYLYYHFYGCQSGTCAITGNPLSSMFFGAFLGFFLVARPCSTC